MNTADLAQPPQRRILSVSDLNREVRFHLEAGFGSVWVEGEVSGLTVARSGHAYFTLKDDRAQVRCALFRQRNPYGRIRLSEGQQILARGRITLYEPRGSYQLIVDTIEDAGEGRLRREFERLKQQLAAEGLFASERKRSLPRFPQLIAVVTSPDGAAIRDVISVIGRRYPAVRLVVVPTRVQGEGAAAEIRRALGRAIAIGPDAVLLTRGGGSLEDLWAFNDEQLARDIAAAAVPVVCAVGHESDVSIAEFAADVRGATPSAAAELLVPDGAELRARLARSHRSLVRLDPRRGGERHAQRIDELLRRIAGLTQGTIRQQGLRLAGAGARLRALHPTQRLDATRRRSEALAQGLARLVRAALAAQQQRLERTTGALQRAAPGARELLDRSRRVVALEQRLRRAGQLALADAERRSGALADRLQALSPEAVLARGYSVTRSARTGAIVRRADELASGEPLLTRLAEGEVRSRVTDDDG